MDRGVKQDGVQPCCDVEVLKQEIGSVRYECSGKTYLMLTIHATTQIVLMSSVDNRETCK